jgi:hypothetical protein
MNEPERILSGGGDEFEALLLGAAKDDGPEPGAKLRTLAALGIASTVAGTATAAASVAAGTSGKAAVASGAASAAAAGAKAGLAATLGKWIVLGALGGGLVVGGASAVTAPEPARLSAQRPFAESIEVAARALAPRAEAPGPVAAPTPAPELAAPSEPARSVASPRPAESAPEAKVDPLAGELAALDRAREALGSGSAVQALSALDAHDRQFPNGPLAPEALMLRIQALAAAGRHAEATRLGDTYLSAHPTGPYARRVRTLLGREAEGGGTAGP